MKKIIAFILSLCAMFFAVGCTGGGQVGSSLENSGSADSTADTDEEISIDGITNETYGSYWMLQHDAETMPVGAYNSCPNKRGGYTYDYLANRSTFTAYKEAGVNVMMGLYESANSGDVLQALDWCGELGLSYLLPVGVVENASLARSMLSQTKYKDGFGGIMLKDEPGRVLFDKLKKSEEIILPILPEDKQNALLHVNLFPKGAKELQYYNGINSGNLPEEIESYAFERYVDEYMAIVKPKVLSYDLYAIRGKEGNVSGTNYFECMSYIRNAAMQANIPFWVFIQTCKFSSNTRIPNLAEVLWQVNTSLSYGAKGIQYFTGVQAADGGTEKFFGAMFDRDGNKTEVYDYVKTANMQIQAVDEVLMRSVSKGIIVCGSMPWTANYGVPEKDALTNYAQVSSVTGEHAIVGCFDHDGKSALYVTNNSITESDTVMLNFSGNESGYFVQKAAKTQFNGQNSLTLTLDAGEGVLVVLNK